MVAEPASARSSSAPSSSSTARMESKQKVSHSSPGMTQSECWSYMVVVFAFLVICIGCGTVYSSPIMMVSFESQLNTTYSVMQKSWLGSSMISCMSLGSILAVPAMRLVGCRGSVIIGGFVAALGPALSVFANSLLFVCLTMGALTGLGVGLTFIPSLLTVELHFPTRGNRLATSVALSGIGVGVAAFPPLLNLAMININWTYCLLILTGALFLVTILGLLMTAPQGMSSSRLTIEVFREDSLSKPAFLSMCLAHFIWSFGSTIMYIYIPVYTLLSGYSSEQAAIMLSCIGGLSFFSRGMFRMVHLGEAVTMDTVTSIFCGLCLTAILTGLFGDFSVKYTGLLSYSMLFGFYCGFWSNFINQVNRETIGKDVATAGSGFAMLATSFGSLAGPPIAGFLYGETESYKNIFYVAGGSMMFCSLLLLGVKLLSIPSARIRKEIVMKISEKTHSKPKAKESVIKRSKHGTAAEQQESGLLTTV